MQERANVVSEQTPSVLRAPVKKGLVGGEGISNLFLLLINFKMDNSHHWLLITYQYKEGGGNALLGPEDIENPKRALESGA